MNRNLVCAITLGFALSSLNAGSVGADTGWVTGARVTITLVDASGNYGGCMALLDKNPKSVLPACGNNWVSFSCTGTYAPKDLAYRMFDTAQLALVTNKTVAVLFDDTKLHNAYCYASRIDYNR